MRLLLSNDDGFDAPGLQALIATLKQDYDVWVSAPAGQCSAQSHAFGLGKRLKVEDRAAQRVAVGGSPADSVYYGLHGLMCDKFPDWIVSGINAGSNLGTDVHYSGTVGAAMEGYLYGVSALAVSLHGVEREVSPDFGPSVAISSRVLSFLCGLGLTKASCWNLNVPNLPLSEIKGVRLLPLSRRLYDANVKIIERSNDHKTVLLGGRHQGFEGGPDTDGPALFDGYATLTPLCWNWTNESLIREVAEAIPKGQAIL